MFKRTLIFTLLTITSTTVLAQGNLCNALPSHAALQAALAESVYPSGGPSNGGLDLNMWGTIVAKDGTVCAVAKTGSGLNDQWLGSRVISAQKANTANAFSLDGSLALSTANLYSAVQPGGSLFGLQESNPVDTGVAYGGNSANFGKQSDPMTGKKIGGVNVFGGGLALYDAAGNLLGALGVSGDTSCADHNVAWRTRDALALDFVPAGLTVGDNIIFDIVDGVSAGGFGHPFCLNPELEEATNDQILVDHPLSAIAP
ncbi:MAG: heme-binding protein [Pseudomonadota bacterium]